VEALEQLESLDSRSAEIAKLYLIWGLTVPEIARAMDLSVATIEREWAFARKWLASRLREAGR
jgi:RNA polymerase sigma-70 factor, ECF subfamily